MKVTALAIPEVKLVEPAVFGDARGYFIETFHAPRYREQGIPVVGSFVQDNVSKSRKGVLRGLHLQHPHQQGKLVRCAQGEVFDVAVDVRHGSPNFGRWVGAHLSSENHHQLWVPPGFAHGFVVLSETALFSYKCSEVYHPESEFAVRWNDPAVGIEWPLEDVTLSEKDTNAPLLADIPVERLPPYEAA
ncbi:MAG: dTDP-4-dehydrorhamnose 3,5-epimerase [Myxococcota bacterium]